MLKSINLILIFINFLVTLIMYQGLPEMVPTHWNIRGEVDSYMPKEIGAWLLPVMTIVMYVLFRVLPKIDPKKKKYKFFKHEWEIIQTGIVGFFTYMHLLILYISNHPETSLMPWFFIGFGSLFILLGNYLSKIRQNYFIGIRLPWTLADEENWNKTHRFASWCFVLVGIVTLIEAYVIWYAPVVIFGSIMLTLFLPVIYSFLIFKKKEKNMKYVLLAIAVLGLSIFVIRLVSGEDDWICKDGEWVKHGNPSASVPQTECQK